MAWTHVRYQNFFKIFHSTNSFWLKLWEKSVARGFSDNLAHPYMVWTTLQQATLDEPVPLNLKFFWKRDTFLSGLILPSYDCSRLPNNRPPWNKRPGWKIVKYIIIVLPGIIVLSGIFTSFLNKILIKLAKKWFSNFFFFLEWKNFHKLLIIPGLA